MAPTDVLHGANTIVGILGVASANPALAGAASGLSAAFSMQEIWRRMTGQTDTLAGRIAADLTAELQDTHLPAQTRLLIPQMIAKAALTPAQIMAAARKPDQICATMLAQLTDPAHKSAKARDGFQRVMTTLLTRHLADPDTSAALRPAFDDAIAAALQHIGQQVDYLASRARDDAHRLGVQEGMLIALARRYVPDDPASFEAALKSVELALETAARMNARALTPQNTGAEVDRVIAEVNRLNALDQMAEADAAIAAAQRDLGAKSADIEAQRALLHTIGLDQARLLAAPDRAADRILAELSRHAHPAGQFRAIHDVWEEWYDRGRAQGTNFDLNVALHLARVNVDRTKGVQNVQALADLGLSQFQLGEQEGRSDRLKQSITTFRTVVAAIKPQSDPDAWAAAKSNLGMALTTLGRRESGPARLEEAIKTFHSALKVIVRARMPLDWAGVQDNLGAALFALGEREPGTTRLEEAVAAHSAALEERSRDHVPLDWAKTQNNLGIVLSTLGEREPGTARLEAAIAAYRGALEEWTRERVPLDWATTQNNLGTVLSALGEREPGIARLEEAIAAYRAALEERMRDRVPLDWAASWGNMAEALIHLADRTDNLALARQALQQLQEAEEVLRDYGHQTFARYSTDRLPRAQAVIDRLTQVGVHPDSSAS